MEPTTATGHDPHVEALFFDVFGTVVDWRTGIAREARAILEPLGFAIDWAAFADAWRAGYQPAMDAVRRGSTGFVRLDVLHRQILEGIKDRFGLGRLEEATSAALNLAWHRLDAWDDVPPAFARLRRRFLMAPVSNGNIALMVDLARRNEIHWDAILGAEVARDYKPKPEVYLSACEAFGLPPSRCMMVAAHSYDLRAASEAGLRTAHVARPAESPGAEPRPTVPVDIAARSFEDLADQLRV
ncbi:MAG: haloacid dehalogenase type II [Betaproteobacteria bacterium]